MNFQWAESLELRPFIAGYLALLPAKKAIAEIDKRFIAYVLELTDNVTGRIISMFSGEQAPGTR